jgi:hypothetical protein
MMSTIALRTALLYGGSPMEGWSIVPKTLSSRDRDEFTARPGNPTAPNSFRRTKSRRQGSGGGIVPRSHAPTPCRGALSDTKSHQRLPRRLMEWLHLMRLEVPGVSPSGS